MLLCLTTGSSFIDAPSFYLLSRDVENIDADAGLGIDLGYGVGSHMWRTNSSNCGSKKAMAFTAIPKIGIQYAFNIDSPTLENGLNYYASLELALFRLLDFRKNAEFFLETGYFMSDGPAFLKIGTRQFINMRG